MFGYVNFVKTIYDKYMGLKLIKMMM